MTLHLGNQWVKSPTWPYLYGTYRACDGKHVLLNLCTECLVGESERYCCISRPQGVLLVFALSVMTLLMGPSITIKCQEVMFSRQYQDQNSNLWTWRGPSQPTLNYFCQTKFHLTYLLKGVSHLLLLVLCYSNQKIFLQLEN